MHGPSPLQILGDCPPGPPRSQPLAGHQLIHERIRGVVAYLYIGIEISPNRGCIYVGYGLNPSLNTAASIWFEIRVKNISIFSGSFTKNSIFPCKFLKNFYFSSQIFKQTSNFSFKFSKKIRLFSRKFLKNFDFFMQLRKTDFPG